MNPTYSSRAAPRRDARTTLILCAGLALAGCAASPDHFYTLNPIPDAQRASPAPTLHLRLDVTVPSLVDRNEMVLNTSRNAIVILDHERWGAPLSDQVSQTLARDLEARRADVFIADRTFDQAHSSPVLIKVDLVNMTVSREAGARIEAHWRIVDASVGEDILGSATFDAPVQGDGSAGVAAAYSRTLSGLADRLVQDLPHR